MTSHSNANIVRQPAGSPDGGKFAAKPGGAEADYALAARGGDGALSVIMQVTHSDVTDGADSGFDHDAEDDSWREFVGSTQSDGYGNWSAMVKPGQFAAEHALSAIRHELHSRGDASSTYLENMAARRRPDYDANGFECWEETESTERYAKKVIDHIDWDDTAQAAYDGDPEALNTMVAEAWDAWDGVPDSERATLDSWASRHQDKINAVANATDGPIAFGDDLDEAARVRIATEFVYLAEIYDEAF